MKYYRLLPGSGATLFFIYFMFLYWLRWPYGYGGKICFVRNVYMYFALFPEFILGLN